MKWSSFLQSKWLDEGGKNYKQIADVSPKSAQKRNYDVKLVKEIELSHDYV